MIKTHFVPLSLLLFVASAQGETFQANVDWAQLSELGSLVGGTVVSTSADVGDRVGQGEELMRIDPTPYQHKISISEAQVKSAESVYESTRQEHRRQQELYEIGSLSTVALQESSYALTRAESDYQLAKAKLEIARYNLAQTTLRTPYDAWVIDKRAFVGQNLSTQQAIPTSFVIARVGKYFAAAKIASNVKEIPRIGSAVRVEVNGKSYTGTLTFPRYSTTHDLNQITVEFSDMDRLIQPGTPAVFVTPE